jgi:hypothetical protein
MLITHTIFFQENNGQIQLNQIITDTHNTLTRQLAEMGFNRTLFQINSYYERAAPNATFKHT